MRPLFIKLIKYLLIPLGMLHGCFRQKSPFIILMYHRVNDHVHKELSVTQADFRRQMDYLNRKGRRVVSLEQALKSGRRQKTPEIVLTFDDGYEDFYTHAFPVLADYGYTSLVYLVPGYIGTDKVFPWDEDIGESRLMSWEQVDTLKKSGLVEFGSHSMSHPDFDRISSAKAQTELRLSRETLEKRLSLPVRHFAYPKGIVAHLNAVKDQYETAVSIFEGWRGVPSPTPKDLVRIQRVPVQRSDGLLLFAARLRGWLFAEGWLKRLLGRH